VPDGDHSQRIVRDLGRRLQGRVWCGVASRVRAEIPAGYREAVDVLALARAAGSDPGVYGRDDFLVEYAVAQHDLVAGNLTAIIEPLMADPVLRETLEALIRADYNRSKAAKDLFIHRSTMDYRLRRIEKITGHSPMTGRGAQLLGAAMTVHALRNPA
jgi:sugar diacid utilization regulator